jgi:hypothetical protein
LNGLKQNPFLNPTAAECIEVVDPPHEAVPGEVVLPGLFEVLLFFPILRGAGLVQENNDRLSDPFKQLQFRRNVPGHVRLFGRIHQIENDVRLLLNVQHGLFRTPGRSITKSIPHLRQNANNRILGPLQSRKDLLTVGEAGCVPELQRLPCVRFQDRVLLILERDVRAIGDDADILPEQRSGQRSLPEYSYGKSTRGRSAISGLSSCHPKITRP